jgi:hypothetical protein
MGNISNLKHNQRILGLSRKFREKGPGNIGIPFDGWPKKGYIGEETVKNRFYRPVFP